MQRLTKIFILAFVLVLGSLFGSPLGAAGEVAAKPKPKPVVVCPYKAIMEIEQSHIEGRVVIYDDGSFRLFVDDGGGEGEVDFLAWGCMDE